MIQYPKAVVILNQETAFRRAVLHALCYYENQHQNHHRDVNHTYDIGYYIGWLTAGYVIRNHQHPKTSYRDLVLTETKRIVEELKKAID